VGSEEGEDCLLGDERGKVTVLEGKWPDSVWKRICHISHISLIIKAAQFLA
jgi:hypothetical protein